MSKLPPEQSGFTLIEVMVALVIFASAAALLILSDGNSVKQIRHLQEKVLAAQVAENYLDQLHAGVGTELSVEKKSQHAGREWVIRQRLINASQPGLQQITIEVFSGSEPPKADSIPIYYLMSYIRSRSA